MAAVRSLRAMWFIVLEIGLAIVLVFAIFGLARPRKQGRDDDQPPSA
ncbi:MAG: hypothetical protein ACREU5_03755 [Burkholderiales bacterium]